MGYDPIGMGDMGPPPKRTEWKYWLPERGEDESDYRHWIDRPDKDPGSVAEAIYEYWLSIKGDPRPPCYVTVTGIDQDTITFDAVYGR